MVAACVRKLDGADFDSCEINILVLLSYCQNDENDELEARFFLCEYLKRKVQRKNKNKM